MYRCVCVCVNGYVRSFSFKFSSSNGAAGPVKIHTDGRDIKEWEQMRQRDALSDRNMRVQNMLVLMMLVLLILLLSPLSLSSST